MAQKRMFDKAIIDTDRFMDLSMSSKALYFLLGMEADDEGFVSYKKVMRVHGGNEDDFKVLVAKNFVILFESGVVVITDWNTNNWLDSRRARPTEYQKEKKLLVLTKGNKYVLSNGLASIVEKSREEYRREELSDKSDAPQNEKETAELCYFGFPLPLNWSETNHGIEEGNDHPNVTLHNEYGQKVSMSQIKTLQKSHKAHGKEKVTKLIPPTSDKLKPFLEVYMTQCKKQTGVTPIFSKDEKGALSKFINKYGLIDVCKVADWFLKSDIPKDQKINIFQMMWTKNLNKYQLETGNTLKVISTPNEK